MRIVLPNGNIAVRVDMACLFDTNYYYVDREAMFYDVQAELLGPYVYVNGDVASTARAVLAEGFENLFELCVHCHSLCSFGESCEVLTVAKEKGYNVVFIGYPGCPFEEGVSEDVNECFDETIENFSN